MPNPASSAPKSGDQDFMFVSVTGRKSAKQASRGEIRKHIAKQHFKRKRLQDITKFQTTSLIGWKRPCSHIRSESESEFFTEDSKRHQEMIFGRPSPQTVLSATQSDPFDCYPVAMRHEDFELIDFCECAGAWPSVILD